ncbi:MAG: glucokinase [Xanthobacteraceae bacterium]
MLLAQQHALLADIGASNARFALLANGLLGPVRYFSVTDFPRFLDVLAAFWEQDCRGLPVTQAVLAVAGPIEANRCVLTNCSWVVDAQELSEAFGFDSVRVCNDFEAAALSLPYLADAHLHRLGGGISRPDAPMVVLGPGTGLGLAGLVPAGQDWAVVGGEGGHATMPASSADEDVILQHLRHEFGHVSAERVISGQGLENLYRAVAAVDGVAAPPLEAASITAAALAGTCATAVRALDLFCAMLGTFAGNVALTFGARGGVYIAGGIAPRITDFLTRSHFRERFEQKGRFRQYLEAIPTSVITHPFATFVGLQSLAMRGRAVGAPGEPARG